MVEKKNVKVNTKEEHSLKLTGHFAEQNIILKKLLTELEHKNELLRKKKIEIMTNE